VGACPAQAPVAFGVFSHNSSLEMEIASNPDRAVQYAWCTQCAWNEQQRVDRGWNIPFQELFAERIAGRYISPKPSPQGASP
jgi:hypothetical protein